MIAGRHDTYFTVAEVAEMAQVAAKTVMNWLAAGRIRSVRLGGRRFVPLSSIERALRSQLQAVDPVADSVTRRQRLFVDRDVLPRRATEGEHLDQNGAEESRP